MEDDDSSDTDKSQTAGTGTYVTELGQHDVLLGRGTGPSNNPGNVNFRLSVEAMKPDYVSTPSRKAKNRLVRKTVQAIKAKNGRFLSKLRKSEIKMLGLSQKVVYEVVSDSIAVEKTKQAIRYVHYKKDAHLRTKDTEPKKKKKGAEEGKSGRATRKPTPTRASDMPKDPSISVDERKSEVDQRSQLEAASQLDAARVPLLQNLQAPSGVSAALSQRQILSYLSPTLSSLFFSGAPNPLLSGPIFPARSPTSVPAGLFEFSSQNAQALPPSFLPSIATAPRSFARAINSNLTVQPSIAGTSGVPSSSGVAEILFRSLQQQGQLQQDQLQTVLQDEQLRAVLLADERYRSLLASSNAHLKQPPR